MLFSAMRFIHEPLARIYRATLSLALTLINGLIDCCPLYDEMLKNPKRQLDHVIRLDKCPY